MQVWTGNGTWSKPQGIRSILVRVVGAGGGGSGYTEAGGAGGHGEVIVDVNNVNSVGVTVGSPGGGAYYNGCGGNGNASSFGGYVSANGGTGANCHNQYAGGLGGHGSGGNLNSHGGGGTGHGSHYSYGNMMGGASYMGGSQLVVIIEIIIMHTLTRVMLHGVLVVTEQSLVIAVHAVERVW